MFDRDFAWPECMKPCTPQFHNSLRFITQEQIAEYLFTVVIGSVLGPGSQR